MMLQAHAPRPADWIFLRRHIAEVGRYEPEMSWAWVELHVGRDAWALALSAGGEPVGFFLFQLPGDTLWISALYMLPGLGASFDRQLISVVRSAARGCGARQIGFRSPRRGWGRALARRFGAAVAATEYTQYAVTIPPAAGEEVSDERQPPDDHDQPGANSPPC